MPPGASAAVTNSRAASKSRAGRLAVSRREEPQLACCQAEAVKPDAERLFRHRLSEMLPRLSRFALGLTRSRADADDLIQSACERALSRIEQWGPGTGSTAGCSGS